MTARSPEDPREAPGPEAVHERAVRGLEGAFGELMGEFRRFYTQAAESVSPGMLPGTFKVWPIRITASVLIPFAFAKAVAVVPERRAMRSRLSPAFTTYDDVPAPVVLAGAGLVAWGPFRRFSSACCAATFSRNASTSLFACTPSGASTNALKTIGRRGLMTKPVFSKN